MPQIFHGATQVKSTVVEVIVPTVGAAIGLLAIVGIISIAPI
jgi:hypothetical protein